MQDYTDIMYMEYSGSRTHNRMSLRDRAAQFAPFAALTGYEGMIDETARYTEAPAEISEDKRSTINDTVKIISDNIRRRPRGIVEYFIPHGKKKGGRYITASKTIEKIDKINGALIACDGTEISVNDIFELTLDEGDGSVMLFSGRFDGNTDFVLDFEEPVQ